MAYPPPGYGYPVGAYPAPMYGHHGYKSYKKAYKHGYGQPMLAAPMVYPAAPVMYPAAPVMYPAAPVVYGAPVVYAPPYEGHHHHHHGF